MFELNHLALKRVVVGPRVRDRARFRVRIRVRARARVRVRELNGEVP